MSMCMCPVFACSCVLCVLVVWFVSCMCVCLLCALCRVGYVYVYVVCVCVCCVCLICAVCECCNQAEAHLEGRLCQGGCSCFSRHFVQSSTFLRSFQGNLLGKSRQVKKAVEGKEAIVRTCSPPDTAPTVRTGLCL